MDGIERKLQEYERNGAEATHEMQQAARTVALENTRLRTMLAQMGATSADVDGYLQACQDHEAARALSSVSLHRFPKEENQHEDSFDKLDVLASATLQQRCCEGKTRCVHTSSDRSLSPSTVEASTGAATPASSYGQTMSPSVRDYSSPMEMSCNAAAQIIAEMQGHGDRDMAKGKLGCDGRSECTVKNAALFHILEGSGQYS